MVTTDHTTTEATKIKEVTRLKEAIKDRGFNWHARYRLKKQINIIRVKGVGRITRIISRPHITQIIIASTRIITSKIKIITITIRAYIKTFLISTLYSLIGVLIISILVIDTRLSPVISYLGILRTIRKLIHLKRYRIVKEGLLKPQTSLKASLKIS